MQGETPITIIGNVVADPELRFTPSGAAVASFRVASTPRHFDKNTNQWEDAPGLFLTCNVWRGQAENVAESITKGMRVIVNGSLSQRSYETREGEKRTVYEVKVEDVGPSLKWASARVQKSNRDGSGGGGGGHAPQGGQRGQGGQRPPAANDDPWGGAQGGYDDEPPF